MPRSTRTPDFSKQFEAITRELERARVQETKPKHLFVHMRRAVIQAARLLLEAMDAGRFDRPKKARDFIGPFGNAKGGVPIPIDQLPDDQLLLIWRFLAVPWLSTEYLSEFKADAGAYDWPKVKTDAKGRLLGKNGKRLRRVSYKDPKTGRTGWKLSGKIATVIDDYDEADGIAHLRAEVQDHADACRLLADVLAKRAGGAGEVPMALNEFMKQSCEPISKTLLNSRCAELQRLHRRGKVNLPKHIGDWRPGQKKYYSPEELRVAWPSFKTAFPGLPDLK